MDNLRNELINAFNEGNFLQVVYEKSIGASGNRSALVEELVSVHNDGLIDTIACFSLLENKQNSGHDFFQIRHVFEKTLPHLNAPVKQVMDCVIHLVSEAGQDMTACHIYDPFVDFCTKETSRPKESLSQIEANLEKLVDLLAPTIVAGARIDASYYLNAAIRLTTHENIEVRKRAIFSLGKIQYSQNIKLCYPAICCLELSVTKEKDDHLLGNLIKSAFGLFIHDNTQVDRSINLINNKNERTTLTKRS